MENISLQDEEFLKWLQTTEYNGSIGLTVKFYVKSEQLPEFHMVNQNICITFRIFTDTYFILF